MMGEQRARASARAGAGEVVLLQHLVGAAAAAASPGKERGPAAAAASPGKERVSKET
jgi:hypothetical protein